MFEQLTPYKPKYLAKDMILSSELRERGSSFARKRLTKERKGTYPIRGTPDICSYWWNQTKKGKKKDKRAMIIMASQYDFLVELLDTRESNVLKLTAKTTSQEEEIKLLQWNLQQRDKEKSQALRLESEIRSQEEEIISLQLQLQQWKEKYEELNHKLSYVKTKKDSLKQTVQKLEEENQQLKDKKSNYNTSSDYLKHKKCLVPVKKNASWQKSPPLLRELPDLQYNNSNYEFWAKIRSWFLAGEVDAQEVFTIVKTKCPQEAWHKIEKNLSNKDLMELTFSNPATKGSLEKLWKFVSEALGSGTIFFESYYYRRQTDSERFEEFLQEKFRLYCSFGVENMEPNKNDLHFLFNVIEKSSKRYQTLLLQSPKSYADLLNKARVIDSMLTTAEWNNECLNCGREGHTTAVCRRPGGGAEVGPNQCYTCGKHGHWARTCWTYQY